MTNPLFAPGEFIIGEVRRHESMNNIDALKGVPR